MELHGRELSLEMQGEDIRQLHCHLCELGFEIPKIEIENQYFGPETHKVILVLQRLHIDCCEEATGVVDERTVEVINSKVNAIKPQPQQTTPEPTADTHGKIDSTRCPAPEQPDEFTVSGQVRYSDGRLFIEGLVEALDRDLRGERQLGDVRTDKEGRYRITYRASQFRRPDKKNADLIVRALNMDESLLVSSDIIFKAPPNITVDLTIGGEFRGPSEYEEHLKAITPPLQGVPLSELSDDENHSDITYLAGDTGVDPLPISHLVVASRLSMKTGLEPEVFYGLFRQGLPTDLPELVSRSPKSLRRELDTAIQNNTIPQKFRDSIDSILRRFQELIVESAFEEPAGPGKASFGSLLSTSSMASRDLQKKFINHYVEYQGRPEDFWKALAEKPEFQNGVAEEFQTTLELSAITMDHLPLLQELQTMRHTEIIKTPRDLAKLDVKDWLTIMNKQVEGKAVGFPQDIPGVDDTEKATNYARALAQTIEQAYPTAVIANRVARDNVPNKQDLVKFFENNPEFGFGKDHVDVYISANKEKALSGVEDTEGVTRQLKGMQRVFKLTPKYNEMRAILADGLDSSHGIVTMGKAAFMEKYREALGGVDRAEEIYRSAEHISANALLLFGRRSPMVNSVGLAVLNNPTSKGGING